MKARRRMAFVVTWLLVARAATGSSQGAPPEEPVRALDLATLQQAAVDADPRHAQAPLLDAQTDLRLRNIAVQRLPTVTVDGQAQYQSDVPTPPVSGPGGQALFMSPKATYDSGIRVEHRLFDATIGVQGTLERATLAEQQARLRGTLFGRRQQVSDAFFTAADLDARRSAVSAAVADLARRLDEANARVREGVALRADAAAIEATLLMRRQDEEELRVARRVALSRLADLTASTIDENDIFTLPDLEAQVARARQDASGVRIRPEYEIFTRTRERLSTQQDLALARQRPRVSTFARVGYGRPGLNFARDQFEAYGLGGIRVQWNAWTWETEERERTALALQAQAVAADQAAFTKDLGEAVDADAALIDRLRDALVIDDRIVALRQEIEESARARFQEGVLTASEFLDRSTDLLQARLARVTHEVERKRAQARLLTTLGLEVR